MNYFDTKAYCLLLNSKNLNIRRLRIQSILEIECQASMVLAWEP